MTSPLTPQQKSSVDPDILITCPLEEEGVGIVQGRKYCIINKEARAMLVAISGIFTFLMLSETIFLAAVTAKYEGGISIISKGDWLGITTLNLLLSIIFGPLATPIVYDSCGNCIVDS